MRSSNRILRAKCVLAAGALLLFAACSGGSNSTGPGGQVSLQGAGSSFMNPLMQKWLSEYGKINSNIRIDYQSIGSGGGIKQIKDPTIDFGATDGFMSDANLKVAPDELLNVHDNLREI